MLLPFRSKNHCPVLGRNKPILVRCSTPDVTTGVVCGRKFAVTVVLAVRLIVKVVDLLKQQPLQPEKIEPAAGVALRVTEAPLL